MNPNTWAQAITWLRPADGNGMTDIARITDNRDYDALVNRMREDEAGQNAMMRRILDAFREMNLDTTPFDGMFGQD